MSSFSDIDAAEAAQVRRRMFSLLLDARGVAESIDAWSRGRKSDALADASAAAWEVVARLEAYGESLND
jgi:hypothetical protein